MGTQIGGRYLGQRSAELAYCCSHCCNDYDIIHFNLRLNTAKSGGIVSETHRRIPL
jgi:hypothetical protein